MDPEAKAMAEKLERAALLIRVAARALVAGSEKAAATTLSEAMEVIAEYLNRFAV